MFISKKQWRELEGKVADLEKQVQDQPLKIAEMVLQQINTKLKEAIRESHW